MNGYKTEAEGYAASLRQMAQWVDEANADPCGHGVIGMEDIDADELRAAADLIERLGEVVGRNEAPVPNGERA